MLIYFTGKPESERLSIAEFQKKFGSEYFTLSEEDRTAFYLHLECQRKAREEKETELNRKLGPHATADIRTLSNEMADAILNSPERCGFAYFAIGAKTDYVVTTRPIDIISEYSRGFCEAVLGMPAEVLAWKFETYNLQGAQAALDMRPGKAETMRARVAELLQNSLSASFIHLFLLYTF